MEQCKVSFGAADWLSIMAQVRAFDAKGSIVPARRTAILPVEATRGWFLVEVQYECPDAEACAGLKQLRA